MRAFRVVFNISVACALSGVIVNADRISFAADSNEKSPSLELQEFQDRAFDRMIDVEVLGRGWDEMNAEALTDAALQFVEAERILRRPRKGIVTDDLLSLVVRVAAERRDQAALKRLAAVVSSRKNEALETQLRLGQELSGNSRSSNLDVQVNVSEISEDEFLELHDCLKAVRRAVVLGDPTELVFWEEWLKTPGLSRQQRERLKRIISPASESLNDSKNTPSPVTPLLDSLVGESRGSKNHPFGVHRPVVIDVPAKVPERDLAAARERKRREELERQQQRLRHQLLRQ